jgi:hypothetical protein
MSKTLRYQSIFRSALLAVAIAAGGVAVATHPAWALTQQELTQAQANFKKANPGGTGLNAAQFKVFIDLNAAAKIGRAAQIKSYGAYDRAFGAVDTNKDGIVTWDEYLKAQ